VLAPGGVKRINPMRLRLQNY